MNVETLTSEMGAYLPDAPLRYEALWRNNVRSPVKRGASPSSPSPGVNRAQGAENSADEQRTEHSTEHAHWVSSAMMVQRRLSYREESREKDSSSNIIEIAREIIKLNMDGRQIR